MYALDGGKLPTCNCTVSLTGMIIAEKKATKPFINFVSSNE